MKSNERLVCFRGSAIVALLGALIVFGGCSSHPEVTSRESLMLIKLVYTAANTRNTERLEQCKKRLGELAAESKISDREKVAFERILATAEAGQWEKAQADSLAFAQAQIR